MKTDTQSIPAAPLWLGLGGLLPFVASAAGVHAADPTIALLALSSLGGYGAVILSFLGGIKWGVVVNDRAAMQSWSTLALSVLPSLIAWPALLLPPLTMLSLLIFGFALQFVLDRHSVASGMLPRWFGRLRLILTAGAILSLLAGCFALVSQ